MSNRICSNYDVIIVGCGIAGSVTGAILTSLEHKRVIVLERAGQIGGRAASFRGEGIREVSDYRRALAFAANTWCSERSEPELSEIIEKRLLDGYVLEIGGRAGWYTNKGKVSHVLLAFNKPTIFYPNVGLVWFDHQWKPHNVTRGTRYGWMTEEDYDEQLKVTKRILQTPMEEAEQYNHVSVKDWCEQITNNELALEWHSNIGTFHTILNDPSLMSMGKNIKAILMSRDAGVHVTNGAWAFAGAPGHRFIVESFADVIRDNGGEIATNAKVKEITTQNGRVTGIVTEIGDETREIKAPVVVSTVPARELLKILPRKALPDDFERKAKRTTNAGMVTAHLGLRKPLHAFYKIDVDPRSFLNVPILVPQQEGYMGNVPIVAVSLSAVAPTVAPEGKHLGLLASNLLDYETRDKNKVNRVIDRMLEFSDVAFPGWRSALEWMLFNVTETAVRFWHLDDEESADIECPTTAGLYLAGEPYEQGVDGAAHSGLVCAGAITDKSYLDMLPPALRTRM